MIHGLCIIPVVAVDKLGHITGFKYISWMLGAKRYPSRSLDYLLFQGCSKNSCTLLLVGCLGPVLLHVLSVAGTLSLQLGKKVKELTCFSGMS